MNDAVKGFNKNFFPVSTVPIIEGNKNKEQLLQDLNTEGLLQDIETQKKYNENIYKLDKNYASLKPLGNNLILRAFVREGKVTDSGLVLGTEKTGVDYIPVYTKGSSGDRYRNNNVPNPFKFLKKAIVVAVNEYEQQLKPGDIVGIPAVRGVADQDDKGTYIALDHDYSFIHPDVDRIHPPTNMKDKDYGYLRMAKTSLTVILPKDEN